MRARNQDRLCWFALGTVVGWAVCLVGLSARASVAQSITLDYLITHYQQRIESDPANQNAYYLLADAYVQKARQNSDVAYFDLAEQALRQVLTLAPQSSKALRLLAYVFYSRHGFVEAVTYANQALALDPTDSHAYAVLGDAHMELGHYAQAEAAYQQMIQRSQNLYSYSRLSGLKSLRGNPQGAIADLQRAIQLGQAARLPPESIAWVQWQLGNEYLAIGQIAAAEVAYQQSLATYAPYHHALAGLAHVRTIQQRYQEAIDLYQQAAAIIPLPTYAAALGDLYTQIQQPEAARQQYALVDYIGALNSLNKILYNRELALFYADHDRELDVAFTLAQKELEARQDIYAYDLLAWVLYKQERFQEAWDAMQQALQLGTRDARLFFHAGMIQQRLGHTAQAQAYLQRALETNAHFHLFYADLARRTLAALQEPSDAAAAQEKRHDN